MIASSCAAAMSSFNQKSPRIHDIQEDYASIARSPDLSVWSYLASWLNHSTQNRCDTRLSVGESWQSTNPDA